MTGADEEAILVCNRVADLPIPYVPADIRVCTQGCLERVWVARTSPPDVRPVCFQCAEVLVAQDPDPQFELPNAAQAAEILRWLKGQRQ